MADISDCAHTLKLHPNAKSYTSEQLCRVQCKTLGSERECDICRSYDEELNALVDSNVL